MFPACDQELKDYPDRRAVVCSEAKVQGTGTRKTGRLRVLAMDLALSLRHRSFSSQGVGSSCASGVQTGGVSGLWAL